MKFASLDDLNKNFKINNKKKAKSLTPVYIKNEYKEYTGTVIRRLTIEEIDNYMSERE